MERKQPGGETVEIEGPAFTRFLFSNSKAGLFWLPIRLFLGFSWLDAGWHKFTDEAWMDGSGEALGGYWARAVAIPEEGRPAITYEWYRGFLQLLLDNGAETWFSYLIVFGEIAVGIGLIFGVLTGFAAFFGALDEHVLPAGRVGLRPTRSCSPWPSASSWPGRSPATTASTAGCCRCSARRGTPPS